VQNIFKVWLTFNKVTARIKVAPFMAHHVEIHLVKDEKENITERYNGRERLQDNM